MFVIKEKLKPYVIRHNKGGFFYFLDSYIVGEVTNFEIIGKILRRKLLREIMSAIKPLMRIFTGEEIKQPSLPSIPSRIVLETTNFPKTLTYNFCIIFFYNVAYFVIFRFKKWSAVL